MESSSGRFPHSTWQGFFPSSHKILSPVSILLRSCRVYEYVVEKKLSPETAFLVYRIDACNRTRIEIDEEDLNL